MPSNIIRFLARAALTTGALLFVTACNPAPASAPAPAGGGKHVDAATAGEIAGRVTFTGTPPAPASINMGIDAACLEGQSKTQTSDTVRVGADGGLQNVFVYVKDGVDPSYTFDIPAESVTLDQRNCMYVPHVVGVRVGQTIEIINSDATLHNVHAMPKINQEFNHGAPVQGFRMKKTFTAPEQMVLFKCNVHAWMTAYVGVMPTPFFAVTGADGSFDLKGLPPGTYTVAAWHEKYGTQTQQITIGDHQTQHASFAFSATSAASSH